MLSVVVGLLLACGGKPAPVPAEDSMVLTSPDFENGGPIPKLYTADGEDVSPALEWDKVPEGTKGFALLCQDPDAPIGTFVHWVIFNIPDSVWMLKQGVARKPVLDNGTVQGVNGFRVVGYKGPAPPRGKPHHYYFRLYALDKKLDLDSKAGAKRLQDAIKGHILAQAELMGTYKR